METAAEPGRTPRSARHRAPRRPEKLGLAGIVISAPASETGAGHPVPQREEQEPDAAWEGRANQIEQGRFASARGRDWDR
jgi:hypothetical protein